MLLDQMSEKLADYDDESISNIIKRGEYKEAADKIRKELRKPIEDKHWLYACLSMCYHEQQKYRLAIKTSEKALNIAPRCPLALWYYATPLYQLGRYDESIAVLDSLLKRGMGIAYGKCGEGLRWSKAVLNDCRYIKSLNYFGKNDLKNAKKWAKLHLRYRAQGVKSIYPKREVLKYLEKMDV